MTTDVINGVPRKLLERCVLLAQDAMGLDFDEHAAIERDIRELLATAQPADHSKHALNMAAHPAADVCDTCNGHGLIGGFVNAESGYESQLCPDCNAQPAADGEREAIYMMRRMDQDAWYVTTFQTFDHINSGKSPQHQAVKVYAQPQQAVAVTDEMRRLREALTKAKGVLEEVWEFSYEHGAASALSARDMAEEISAVLSAHKTGEEE